MTTTNDADVLDRPETTSTAQEQVAGIAARSEEEKVEAAKTKRAYEELSWEMLLEQMKPLYAETEFPEAEITKFKDELVARYGDAFVIPKVADDAPENNGQLFNKLFKTLKAVEGSLGKFFHTEEGATIDASAKGVFFLKGEKEFTAEDAHKIALLAMHNKNLMPPNEIKLTGKPEERLLILSEIKKLNDLLPQNARFTIDAQQLQELERFATNAAPVVAAAGEPVAQQPEEEPFELTEEMEEQPESEKDIELIETTLNQYPTDFLAHSKTIGTYDLGDGEDRPVYKSEQKNADDFLFVRDADDRLKVLAVEGTPEFDQMREKVKPLVEPEPVAAEKSDTSAEFTDAADAAPKTETLFDRMARLAGRGRRGEGPSGPERSGP